jgi:hypothetical protein
MKFPKLIGLFALVFLLAATAAYSQTSGALLSIKDSGHNVIVQVYDSQIHSTIVHPGACSSDTSYPTDAFVLQGGSWTGCDPGDEFEVTDIWTQSGEIAGVGALTPRPSSALHQAPGSIQYVPGFQIETHYICAGGCVTTDGGGVGSFCSTSGTFCAGPDSGFVMVKNTTASTFTGTITLSGACGGGATASDIVNGLAAGATAWLAVSTESSNCGGFNADQILPISQGTTTTFLFGKDQYTITPVTFVNSGDQIAFRPVPVPQGVFAVAQGSPFGLTNGLSQTCVSIGDFSAPGNAVCPELQFVCLKSNTTVKCDDNEQFFQQSVFNGHLNPNDPLESGGIGNVHFLGATDKPCTQTFFDSDSVVFYTGDSPSDLPLGSGGKLNCFVTTFEQGATPVPAGVTVKAFDGFFQPVDDNQLNVVQIGKTVPVKFKATTSAGVNAPGITNLHLCSQIGCSGVPTPWILLTTSTISCAAAAADTSGNNYAADDTLITTSGLQNLGGGNYLFTWKIPKDPRLLGTCAGLNVFLSNGTTLIDLASFKFGNQ